jgi:glyoxylate/hydroxypyruvate reductase
MTERLQIVICSYLEPNLVERIQTAAPDVDVVDAPELLPVPRYACDHTGPPRDLDAAQNRRWAELLSGADICFDFDWQDPANLRSRAPALRWVQATSAGIGGYVERIGLTTSGILFTTAAGAHAAPLTEFALTAVLHFVKGVPHLEEMQRRKVWKRYAVNSLAGRRALVVGLGSVGRRVAETLAGLGVEVWGVGRPGHSYKIPQVAQIGSTDDLASMLPHCSIVVLCTPLTAATAGLIGAAELDLMPADTVLVNIARGEVLDEDAVTDRMRDRRLLGLAMDVASVEPLPASSPLWAMDNVLISPHSASTLVTENATLVELFLDNLTRFRAGAPMRNVFSPVDGY